MIFRDCDSIKHEKKYYELKQILRGKGMYVLGIDIGGTKCAAVTAEYTEESITLLKKTVCDTDLKIPPEKMLERLFTLADGILDRKPESIGISCGGPLDSERGIIMGPPNLPGWDNVEIVKAFEKRYAVKTRLQNDANACALAEWRLGAGRGCENMIFLTFGTGLGAGLILGGKLLLCGNGGSAADCEHIAGELMKGFLKKRPLSAEQKERMKKNMPCCDEALLSSLQCGLPAISLPSMISLNSAFCNDVEPELTYAQAVLALAKDKDVLVAISTSGISDNVCRAAKVAKGLGCRVIGLTGRKGGKLKEYSDICVCVAEDETFKIQELHLPAYHCICALVEAHFYE